MAVRRIEPILAEIIEALDGIAAATAGKLWMTSIATGCFDMASSAGSKSFPKLPGTFRRIWQPLLPRFHGNKFVG
jgi:hypothetical protein